jgi:WhiB family redox-sensing transcriptional regulator
MEQYNWAERAKCKGREDLNFFPEKGEHFPEIIEFCSDCPVKVECFDYAVRNRLDDGYWGGTSGNQRNLYRRKMARLS